MGEQGHRPEQAERDDKGHPGVVMRLVHGRGPADCSHPGRDREHGDDLPPAHGLAQQGRSDHQQEDEPDGQRGLHERERREREGEGLQGPPAEVERDPEQPAWTPDQPPEQPDSERMLMRDAPGFERLEGDTRAVQSRGPERGEQPEEETAH